MLLVRYLTTLFMLMVLVVACSGDDDDDDSTQCPAGYVLSGGSCIPIGDDDDDDDTVICEPGETRDCGCPGFGDNGVQGCRDDGSGWTTCDCPSDDDDDDTSVCDPGETRSCACPDGGTGAQECRNDASGWQTCECEDGDDDDDTVPANDDDDDSDNGRFEEDFSSSGLGDWTVIEGDWAVAGGALTGIDDDLDECVIRYNQPASGDYTVEVDMKPVRNTYPGANVHGGIVFNRTGLHDYEHFYARGGANQWVYVSRRGSPSTSTEVATASHSAQTGQTYRMKVVVSGGQADFYVDGTKLFTRSFSAFSNPYVGLKTIRAEVDFDNFVLQRD